MSLHPAQPIADGDDGGGGSTGDSHGGGSLGGEGDSHARRSRASAGGGGGGGVDWVVGCGCGGRFRLIAGAVAGGGSAGLVGGAAAAAVADLVEMRVCGDDLRAIRGLHYFDVVVDLGADVEGSAGARVGRGVDWVGDGGGVGVVVGCCGGGVAVERRAC